MAEQTEAASDPIPKRRLSTRRKLFFAAIPLLLLLTLLYLGRVLSFAARVHTLATTPSRGWRGKVHAADPELGYAPIPGALGAETFTVGPEVPSRIGPAGFRRPVDEGLVLEGEGPLVLSLGCSFTYGAACLAEETFSYRVAAGLKGRLVNAGVCGHGLAQMHLRAKELIPRYKPQIVLAQFSPWLMDRAVSGAAPTYFGALPTPYYTEAGELAPPSFHTLVFSLPVSEYQAEDPPGFASFLFRVGGPLCVHDDLGWTGRRLRKLAGRVPEPCAPEGSAEAFYPFLAELCREQGARLVIVDLRVKTDLELPPPPKAVSDAGPVAQTHRALYAALSEETEEAYGKAYWHWRGDPPVLVDTHPNARAHELIANEVLAVIRATPPK